MAMDFAHNYGTMENKDWFVRADLIRHHGDAKQWEVRISSTAVSTPRLAPKSTRHETQAEAIKHAETVLGFA